MGSKTGRQTHQKTENYSNITSCFIGVLISVYLFSFGNGGYEAIDVTKRHLFYVICGGYCAIVTVMLVYQNLIRKKTGVSIKHIIYNSYLAQLFAVLYLLFTLISTVTSPYHQFAWVGASRGEGFITIALYCLTFVYVAQYVKISQWMVYALGVSCAVLSCICLLQMKSVNVFSLYPDGYTYWDGDVAYNGKYIGTIGNIDHFSAFLSLAIPVLWCAVLRMRDKKRFVLCIPLVLLLIVLVRIRVAAGLLAVSVGAILCLPFVIPTSKRNRGIMLLFLVVLISFGIFFVRAHDFDNQTLHEAHAMLSGDWDPSYGSGRLHIWSEVLKKSVNRLALGYGPDTMIYVRLEPFQRYDDALGKTIISLIDAAHNEYLNILFHQGIFALFAYLCMIMVSLTGWVKKAETSVPAAICGCGIVCYCIQAFFGISQPITSPFFWVLLALLVNSCNIRIASVLR